MSGGIKYNELGKIRKLFLFNPCSACHFSVHCA